MSDEVTATAVAVGIAATSIGLAYALRPELPEETLRDRLRGMILLGAYADALGAPQEVVGLKLPNMPLDGDAPPDTLKSPADLTALVSLSEYGREKENDPKPFGLWVDPDAHESLMGMPTDDSAIRLALVYPWIAQAMAEGTDITETDFEAYLRDQTDAGSTTWSMTRQGAAADLARAYDDLKAHRAGHNSPATNMFWTPTRNLMFGIFLFQELGLADIGATRRHAFRAGEKRTGLDQAQGRFLTGLMSLAISRAPLVDPGTPFDAFFFGEAEQIERLNLGKRSTRTEMMQAFHESRAFGVDDRDADANESEAVRQRNFVWSLGQHLFEEHPPDVAESGYAVYHPTIFLRAFAAAVGYAGADHMLALRILAASVGDADTMPALLGSLIGAYAGKERLIAEPAVQSDFDKIEQALATHGGVEIEPLVDGFVALVRRKAWVKLT